MEILLIKICLTLTLLWTYYEVVELSKVVKEARPRRFIERISRGLLYFIALRVLASVVEYEFNMLMGYLTAGLMHAFFIYITFAIRGRRMRILEMNKRVQNVADELTSVLETLETEKTKKQIQRIS